LQRLPGSDADRLNSLKANRDGAKAALERAKSHSSQAIQIDPVLLEQFGRSMRENFTSGSIPFRKAYLQFLIDVIEVDDTQIRIKGSKDVARKSGPGQPEWVLSGFADEY
jgi:site-specific DNA recombinase